ncbi:MAG: D-aminoacyl-tRNA deacylase [Flavobacteriaceae bacterium]|jgi:D-tyrosyl-tRNA(Tyr) deacylase|nr:D-aminoacyl-tRNA deacylase [Flavobacteriaceae bacterium]
MRVVLQRVRKAQVTIEENKSEEISQGILVLLGIEMADTLNDVDWLVNKVLNLRIFDDEHGVMNKSLMDISGELMVVSQFTLMAATKKGNRPSYIRAANHQHSIPLYESFIEKADFLLQSKVATGSFGAMMRVTLENDGPVTIWLDSKNKE